MDNFFRFLNLFPMPVWLAMMFAPDNPTTERVSRSSSIFIIAAFNYVLSLIIAISSGAKADEPAKIDFSSLDGVRDGLSSKPGALGAWAHMLALDLFTGAWIYRQCQRLGAPAWIRIPALAFTLLTGPFGLLIFLVWRMVAGGQPEKIYE